VSAVNRFPANLDCAGGGGKLGVQYYSLPSERRTGGRAGGRSLVVGAHPG